MKKAKVKKVMVFDQRLEGKPHPAFLQLMSKAKEIFRDDEVKFIAVTGEGTDNPEIATMITEAAVKSEQPDILLIGATSVGEELAPSLGVRLKTGVAAHCVDITVNKEGRMVYMVPAFGGKFIGEIFIPGESCAIVTVKPGIFTGDEESAGEYESLFMSFAEAAEKAERYEAKAEADPAPFFRLEGREEKQQRKSSVEKAKLIFCGGFGIGSKESWQKLELLAEKCGGGAGCTRPVVDMSWGPDEYSMIGTSGKTVRPKAYVGFGISGAAHHICGIKDADIIININNDKAAEVFASSDYKAVVDAQAVIDNLLQAIEL